MIGNGGYTYTKKGDLANGKSAWICTQRGPEKKCPAHITCHENNGVMKVYEYFHTHVHDPDATSISRNKVSSAQAFLQLHLKQKPFKFVPQPIWGQNWVKNQTKQICPFVFWEKLADHKLLLRLTDL